MKLQDHLKFIGSRESDDDDRIERMKDLLIESDSYTDDECSQIGRTLEAIIKQKEEDVVLRQHAANEIGYYWKTPSPALRKRFEDPEEDEDVRYNLQASFKNAFPIEALQRPRPEQVHL